MRKLGLREVAVSRLQLDGNWRERMASPSVKARADGIAALGVVMADPGVRWSDKRVIYGRDRIAALISLGQERIQVVAYECTDEEASLMAIAENTERRHETSEEQRANAERQARELAAAIAASTGKRASGRGPGSAQAEADRRIAETTGVTPAALRKRRERARKRSGQEPEQEPVQEVPREPPKLETFGISVDPAWLGGLERSCENIDEALSALTRVMADARKVSAGPHHPSALQQLQSHYEEFRTSLRGMRPWGLCPWCKGQEPAMGACAACCGTALALHHQIHNCPSELLIREPLKYYDHGVLCTVEPHSEDWDDL